MPQDDYFKEVRELLKELTESQKRQIKILHQRFGKYNEGRTRRPNI